MYLTCQNQTEKIESRTETQTLHIPIHFQESITIQESNDKWPDTKDLKKYRGKEV